MTDPAPDAPEDAPRDFEGRVALVLGASRGIGAATARAFARRGAHVWLASRDAAGLDRVAAAIRGAGGRATVQRVDLEDPASVEALGARLRSEHGRLDCAFNNAGEGAMPAPLAELPREVFERVFRVTVTGTFLAMQQEIPLLRGAGGGSIVNMSSTAGVSAFKGGAPYVAAKHAILGLTKAAALDYAAERIRVNAVAPGPIETERLAEAPEAYREQARQAVPSRRLGRPEEVAEAVLWLASGRSGFVTGTTLLVDGGRLAGFA